MASSRSSPPPMPFGYSFHGLHDFPQHPAPAPAPGPALLDDTESTMLDTFFDTMGTGQFDHDAFSFEKAFSTRPEMSSNFGWVEDLPPTFHGSTTSLPQSGMLSHNLPPAAYGNKGYLAPSSRELRSKIMSADVLAAASTLVRNGHHQQSNGLYGSPFCLDQPLDARTQDIPNSASSTGSQSLGTYSDVTQSVASHSAAVFPQGQAVRTVENGDALFHDLCYGPSSQIRPTYPQTAKAPEIQWGSDVSFLDHGYVAPPNQETEEEVTQTLMHKMECFEPQRSANTTRPSSPLIAKRIEPAKRKVTDDGSDETSEKTAHRPDDDGVSPRKRRKNKFTRNDDTEADAFYSSDKAAKRKSGGNGSNGARRLRETRETSEAVLPKRRKSHLGESKSNRENLTEEQKRSNHILSEQKRRNLIKQGFEDLCKLVPELKGGGFSKSAMLIQAADWLEDIIRGNEILRAQLAGLQDR